MANVLSASSVFPMIFIKGFSQWILISAYLNRQLKEDEFLKFRLLSVFFDPLDFPQLINPHNLTVVQISLPSSKDLPFYFSRSITLATDSMGYPSYSGETFS